MGNLLETKIVDGPGERTVRLRFYDDDSMRIELPEAGPMVLAEAFLSGKAHTVVIKLDPKTKRRNSAAARSANPKSRALTARKVPRRRPTRPTARSVARSR